MTKKTNKNKASGVIRNQRAKFDYDIKSTFIAGMALTGAEVSSIRNHHASLKGSFVQIKNNEAWLVNSLVTPMKTNMTGLPSEQQTRDRKLLLKKKELEVLIEAKQAGNTIIPLNLFTNKRYIKLEIATARGKRKYDKRQAIKKRDQERESRREVKYR